MKVTKEEVKWTLAYLSRFFAPPVPFDQASVGLWYEALSDLHHTYVKEAALQWVKTRTAFPYPAELIETARALTPITPTENAQ